MGPMTEPASLLSTTQQNAIGAMVRRVDEDRWLSSRYASAGGRRVLEALYAFNYELARVRVVVSEPALGAIRFQWWHDVLEEISAGRTPRRHDVALAVAAAVAADTLNIQGLVSLLERHEAAFETGERAREPEGLLMELAASALAPHHGWGAEIARVAPEFAAARRGEARALATDLQAAPPEIRPAVAHARLRRLYRGDKDIGPVARRLSILRAIVTGRV